MKERWFDPWLIARGDGLQRALGDVLALIGEREARRRRLTASASEDRRLVTETLLANLALAALGGGTPLLPSVIIVQMGNRRGELAGIDRKGLGGLPKVVRMMQGAQLLNLK